MKIYFQSSLFNPDNFNSSIGLLRTLFMLEQKNIELYTSLNEYNKNLLKVIVENEKVPLNIVETYTNEDISVGYEKNFNYLINKSTNNFISFYNKFISTYRFAEISRKTKETEINLKLWLDKPGTTNIKTGLGFFDHMLEQIAKHSNISLFIKAKGDLIVDEHHLIEDVGIVFGQAVNQALKNKLGINRYGYSLPMDDASTVCMIDLGGRAYLNFNAEFKREKLGEFPTELVEEFFRAVANEMKANIYLKTDGKNEHHKIESIFKAFAKALNMAFSYNSRNINSLPTTKGTL